LLLRCFQPLDLVTADNKDVAYSPGMPVTGGRQRWEFLIRLPGLYCCSCCPLSRLAKLLKYPSALLSLPRTEAALQPRQALRNRHHVLISPSRSAQYAGGAVIRYKPVQTTGCGCSNFRLTEPTCPFRRAMK
jgi:hypothetical protein